MRILLIMPDANMHKLRIGGRVRSSREAPLTLTTLAALTAGQPDVHYQLVDESVDAVPLDASADLVGISVMTGTARRAYALADHFKRRGLPVVLGGPHATLLPQEAGRFADSLVVGPAEDIWPRLLEDFRQGKLKPEYRDPREPGEYCPGIPTPRWELQRKSGYMVPYTVHATRGCVHQCDFCSVPGVWRRFQRRPVAEVIRDVQAIPEGQRFALNDVSPFDDIEYAKELLRALAPLKRRWGGLATTRIADDPELFDLLVRSGCRFLLIGFESVNQRTLDRIGKGFNRQTDYHALMRKLHEARIIVQGCFVFGFDEDHPDVFSRTVDWVQGLKVDIPRYSIYTPYPGTRLFRRLQAEGRMLSYDWGDYDTMHVVFRPKNMSPVELYEGFRWAYKETFKIRNIWRRTLSSGWNLPIAFVGNLTYRMFVKRLYRSKAFEMPLPEAAQSLYSTGLPNLPEVSERSLSMGSASAPPLNR
ncbi:MAG: radical SAM protein [Elusimicrobiota bacterium]